MKNNRHTPGPWWIERSAASSNYVLIVMGKDKENWETIAEVPGIYNRKTKSEEFPNAHLIAAASEMIEALKVCLPLLQAHNGEPWTKALALTKAAIAKATGGTE